MENTNLAKKKIQQKLNGIVFKSNQWVKYLILGITFGFVILFIILTVVFAVQTIKTKTLNLAFLISIVVSMIVFFFVITGVSFWAARTGKNNQDLLKKVAGMELHQIYFDNIDNPFPALGFKFDGIGKSEIFNNHCLKFRLGSESIIWNIDEDIETRHRGTGDDEETYKVYILKFVLNSTAKKLQGVKEIIISEAKKINFGEKSFLFKSESMEFNQKYRVESIDEMEVYKIFTPKIIENFNTSNLNLSEGEIIYLENNLVQIKFRSHREAFRSLIPDPLDFSAIRFGKNRGKTIDDIYNKIKLDFDRYLEIQELLEPLELYTN